MSGVVDWHGGYGDTLLWKKYDISCQNPHSDVIILQYLLHSHDCHISIKAGLSNMTKYTYLPTLYNNTSTTEANMESPCTYSNSPAAKVGMSNTFGHKSNFIAWW